MYHSIYDTYAWYTRFADKDFLYGKTLSEVMIRTMLRFSESVILPFEFGRLASTIREYTNEIDKQAGVQKVDWQNVPAELNRMDLLARKFDSQVARVSDLGANGALASVNIALAKMEQSLQVDAGLPDRPWYKHSLTAPGMYTGYGAKTLPGVREAIDRNRGTEANGQAKLLGNVLRRFNSALEQVIAQLERVRS